jgi:hypothetical protein
MVKAKKVKPASEKNYYFDEESFQKMLRKYKRVTKMKDNKVLCKDLELEERMVKEIEKIVNAIIIVHRYYVFEDYDDLKQHALNACYLNFLKFSPDKGTSYNYFSIISKISLLNFTTRRKKHRNHSNIEDCLELEHIEPLNYDLFFDDLENTLFGVIDENYIGKKRIEYVKIASIILDYLRKTKKFIGKSDLYAWGRSFGIKNNNIREFVKEMNTFREEIFNGVM